MAENIEDKLTEILSAFGLKLEQDLADSLEKNGVVGSDGNASKLAGSIKYIMLKDETGVGITMADYWEYVEKGTRPSKYANSNKQKHSEAKINSLIAWIKWKGGVGAFNKKAQPKSIRKTAESKKPKKPIDYAKKEKSLAWAIATNISKKGTSAMRSYRGTDFVKEVFEDGRITELTELIAKEIGIDITVDITKALRDGNN